MFEFFTDVAAVVCGIVAYKKLEGLYDDIRWRFKQRHSASSHDPWDSW